MTTNSGAGGPPTGVPLPDLAGQGETPTEIVYARYSYKASNPEGERVIVAKRSHVTRRTDIAGFVQERIDGRRLPRAYRIRRRSAADPKPDRRLNVYVGDPCWVVIELDGNIDWRFEPGQPGITVESGHGDDNCDLQHVLTNGALVGSVAPGQGICRLIYFRVQKRSDYQHQRFYCRVLHGLKGLEGPDMVDPDIPNDGGRFPFPIGGPLDECDR